MLSADATRFRCRMGARFGERRRVAPIDRGQLVMGVLDGADSAPSCYEMANQRHKQRGFA